MCTTHSSVSADTAIAIALQLTTVEKPSPVFVPPPNIVMDDFTSLKESGVTWFSPPFYSHIGGYMMCLHVDPNGHVSGAGTHVSVFVCLMCGEYDDNLRWPFRGVVTIQLLNQRRDKGHKEDTVLFDNSTPDMYTGRVTEGERTLGWGKPNFIPHSALYYDKSRNVEFLKNNCLEFRITQVKLTTPSTVTIDLLRLLKLCMQ